MEWWRIVIRVIQSVIHVIQRIVQTPWYIINGGGRGEPMINTISLSIHSEWKMFWGNIKGQWAWINIFKWLPPPHLFLQRGCETTKAEHATTRETNIKQCEIICTYETHQLQIHFFPKKVWCVVFRMFTTWDTGIWFSRSLWCADQLYRIGCDPSRPFIFLHR